MADFCDRFKDRIMTDVVKEFNKLKQDGSVEDYQIRFEDLKLLLLLSHPTLGKLYFMSSFINELSDDLQPTIKMLQQTIVK